MKVDAENERERELFRNFAFNCIKESLARVQQAKEYLDDHEFRTPLDATEIMFWDEEYVRRLRQFHSLTISGLLKGEWTVFLEFFETETEVNYTVPGQLAKFYRYLTNERLPFDED